MIIYPFSEDDRLLLRSHLGLGLGSLWDVFSLNVGHDFEPPKLENLMTRVVVSKFPMGWFNHQLVMRFGGVFLSPSIICYANTCHTLSPKSFEALTFLRPQRWHPARGRFGDGLRLADVTLRQRTYDGEKLPLEKMSEMWKPKSTAIKGQEVLGSRYWRGICSGRLMFHLPLPETNSKTSLKVND